MAILAAILVPALLGWIDEAKKKQYVLDARNIYMATQTVADEKYAASKTKITATDSPSWTADDTARILKIADMTGNATIDTDKITAPGYKVTGMEIQFTKGGPLATLNANGWTIGDTAAGGTS